MLRRGSVRSRRHLYLLTGRWVTVTGKPSESSARITSVAPGGCVMCTVCRLPGGPQALLRAVAQVPLEPARSALPTSTIRALDARAWSS
jgi:hypothetical protein